MENLTVKVNGVEVSVPAGSTVLEAAHIAGIEIPTLCYMKEINEIGACRICVTEVNEGRGFRLVAAEGGTVIAAGIWGKYKTAVTMITIIFMIPNFGGAAVHMIEQIMIYLSLALTVISLIDYLIHNKSVLAGKM